MKPILKLLLVWVLGGIPLFLSAQKTVSINNKPTWSIIPSWPLLQTTALNAYNSSGSGYTEGISTGIIKLNDSSIIANVQAGGREYGVIRENKDMTTAWLDTVDNYPLTIGLFHGKVLVITARVLGLNESIYNYTGYLIDKETGKILLKKNFYTPDAQFYEQPVFLYAPDSSFFKMVVRTSLSPRKKHGGLSFNKQYFTSSDFKVLEFDENLDLKNTIHPVLKQGTFLGATTNKNGDVFLMTYNSKGFIKIARYADGKTIANKALKTSIGIRSFGGSFLFTSKTNPSVLFLATVCEKLDKNAALLTAKFNFEDSTVNDNTQVIDENYLKNLEKTYVPFDKKFKKGSLGKPSDLKIVNMIEHKGKLIVGLSSILVGSSFDGNIFTTDYTVNDLLINLYDDKQNLKFQRIIPRTSGASYQNYYVTAGMHLKNDVLYIASNYKNNSAQLSQVNLETGAVTNITQISSKGIAYSDGMDAAATVWFDNQFILQYLEKNGFSHPCEVAHLQLVNYE